MRAGTPWRLWEQLGRAYSAGHLSALNPDANLKNLTFSSWIKLSETSGNLRQRQEFHATSWRSHSAGREGETSQCQAHSTPNPKKLLTQSFPHADSQIAMGGQPCFSMSNSGHSHPSIKRLFCVNYPTLDRMQGFKPSLARTQVSNASSQEPEHWDVQEPSISSKGPQEECRLERNQQEVISGQDQGMMMMGEDEVDWGQKHIRVREYETRQRSGVLPVPPPRAEPSDVYIPVKACYVSRSVDLKRLSEEKFLEITNSRNNLIIRFANRAPDAPPTSSKPGMAEISRSQERYMVAFQYGSIVFFNFADEEEEEALCAVRKFCTDEFRETRKDDYGVLVRPTLQEWSEGGQDQIMLRMLDTDNIRVISSILGQSIALDHYAKKVDEMVNTFSELNRGMEKTGTFTMTRKSLFQLVAAANTTLADVILRLGLLERSDAAWKDANYAQIWEYLRDDFELDERFESLDFKLNIIQHNVRFFLEILQNRKSDTLEWIIILLITGEICVSLYQILHDAEASPHHYKVSEPLFHYFGRKHFFSRSDVAWEDASNAKIWEYLRDDFELDERFSSLDWNLYSIQHNVQFFLEILKNW